MDVRRGHRVRVYMVVATLLATYGALIVRLGHIQVADAEHYRELAAAQHVTQVRVVERRGTTYDRMGRELALSVKVPSVFANPQVIRDIPAVAARLAEMLDLDRAQIEKRLAQRQEWVCLKSGLDTEQAERLAARPIIQKLGEGARMENGRLLVRPDAVDAPTALAEDMARLLGGTEAEVLGRLSGLRPFVFIKRKVTSEEREQIKSAGLPGVGMTEEYQRTYPQGVAAALVGFVGIDENGLEGVEKSMDAVLASKPGYVTFRRDAAGRLISDPSLPRESATPGCDIQLSIDAVVQRYAEEALEEVRALWAPKAATAIVLDIRNGDLLGAASSPTFDANDHGDLDGKELRERCRARYITDWMEPGSVMKPFVLAGVLAEGLVTEQSIIFCENGAWIYGPRRLRDHHAYGNLTVEMVIVKSSNIGAAKLGGRLGAKRLYGYLRGFGFGQSTGFPLPGENPGLLRPWSQWRKYYSVPSISMGQEVCSTTLQMGLGYATLANDGERMAPRLVLRVRKSDGTWQDNPPRPQGRVVSASVAKRVRQVLFRTVEEGTGTRAKSELYSIGGKTGTAQKAVGKTFSHRKLICSFVAMAPIEDPRVVVIVSVDEPMRTAAGRHYGGTVAAPAVGQIIERTLAYLGVAPDKPQVLALLDTEDSRRRAAQ